MLATPRRIVEGDRLIRAGRPWSWSWDFMLGRDAWGSTLGLVGLGAIAQGGRHAARRGFSMDVVYWKPDARRRRRSRRSSACATSPSTSCSRRRTS